MKGKLFSPPDDCAHCQNPDASADCRWLVKACAADKKRRWRWLCEDCDIKLNRMVMKFFKYQNTGKAMSAYVRKTKEAPCKNT